MHQSGALESVVRPFVPQLKMRQAAQFLVDERQKGVERLAVSAPPAM
jgi:hypothetical protein